MGRELPDNLVDASINRGVARNVCSQGELKVAQLIAIVLPNKARIDRAFKKKLDVELFPMTSAHHIACNFYPNLGLALFSEQKTHYQR